MSFYYERKKSKAKAVVAVVLLLAIIAGAVVAFIFYREPIMKWINGVGDVLSSATATPTEETATPAPTPTPRPEPIVKTENTIGTRFTPPEGFERVAVEGGSFREYLRNLPLKPYGTQVYLWDGTLNLEAPTEGVLNISIKDFKWQQCADFVMRLWGEYLYANQQYDKISFDFYTTPVFKCDFLTWSSGKRVVINSSNAVVWEDRAEEDYSYSSFAAYMSKCQEYANTTTLKNQMKPVLPSDLQIGDVFVTLYDTVARKMGHAVIIVDMVINPETGEKLFLLAEGNTPTTESYIILNDDESMGVWHKLAEDNSFTKNSWVCTGDFIRRFE